ncbi:MAG: dTDP-glucose 4,6-dehydratase [Spirochaetia bacterium]|nr:dTDP-glucose 4,6-dehydratase [Spirochaetia bacterium]
MRTLKNILVTGGAGFIGSNFVHHLSNQSSFTGRVIVYDLLTYASPQANVNGNGNGNGTDYLNSAQKLLGDERFFFQKGDINDPETLFSVFEQFEIDTVIHFAAETHVDTSIIDPGRFVRTNVNGTFSLLETAQAYWKGREDVLFHQISTDEEFGSLGISGKFSEVSSYQPRNPYAASKAAADHLVKSYYHTYGLPVTLSYSSNNYGPNQHEEKLIPSMISRMVTGKKLPIYGDGMQVREWLYVGDHVKAIWNIAQTGETGESYAVGSGEEIKNIDLVQMLCCMLAEEAGLSRKRLLGLLTFVKDRLGHDRRYALDHAKIKEKLGWIPETDLEDGLRKTIIWYLKKYNF